jgi:signal transduction histidine kinase
MIENKKYEVLGLNELKVLIIDDDEQVLDMTNFLLEDFQYYNCKLRLFEARSAKEARQIYEQNPDIAVALVDIIMESDDAGLLFIQSIREQNDLMRLIIRTGQPGIYPPEEIFLKYDINDYLNKNDLSHQRMSLAITAALRNYLDILLLQHFNTQKISQERLLLSQSKNAVLGEMIQAITHQWSQPLTILKMSHECLDMDCTQEHFDAHSARENLAIMQNQIVYMSNTLHDFKNFFSPNKEKTYFTLEDAVSNAQHITSNKYFALNVQNSLRHYIYGHLNELSQVLIILFNNTCDAIKDRKINDAKIDIWTEEDDKRLYIYIHDNAGGIPQKVLEHIFSKYNTSKNYGTGIGLYLCKFILNREFDGDINAFNQDDGACFLITLPLSSPSL